MTVNGIDQSPERQVEEEVEERSLATHVVVVVDIWRRAALEKNKSCGIAK